MRSRHTLASLMVANPKATVSIGKDPETGYYASLVDENREIMRYPDTNIFLVAWGPTGEEARERLSYMIMVTK